VTRLVALAACLVLLLPAAAAAATPQFSMNEIEQEVMCPVCGTRLDLSHSPAADQIRQYIAEKRSAGWTKQQVEDALVQQFGRQILASTPTGGSGLGAWVVPIALGIGGVVIAGVVLIGWRRRAGPEPTAPPLPAEADRKVDEALARFASDDL
jgi:cytochrome c-type biogenesis protein CcmH/NrfF